MLNKSFVNLVSLVILNCLGTGLIMLPPQLSQLGLSTFFAWALTGLGAFSIGMIFVRLGEESKSQNFYLQNLISDQFSGFWQKLFRYSFFWQYWLLGIFSNAFLSCTLLQTLGQFFPDFVNQYALLLHIIIFGTFYFINRFGIQLSRRITNILSVIKILILIVFPLFAVFALKSSIPIALTPNPVGDMVRGMFITLWAFLGIESIAMEGNIDLKAMKPAMITGVAVCLATFILNTYVMMRNIPGLSQSTCPYADLFGLVFGTNFKWIAVSALVIVLIGSLHGWTTTAVSTANSGEDMLPGFLRQKNKYGVNESALIFASVVPVLLIIVTQFILKSERLSYAITDMATSMCLFIYLASALVFFLRFVRTKYSSKIKRALDLVYIALGTGYSVIALIGAPIMENLFALGLFVVFCIVFWKYKKSR